jgi:hypothetical protein
MTEQSFGQSVVQPLAFRSRADFEVLRRRAIVQRARRRPGSSRAGYLGQVAEVGFSKGRLGLDAFKALDFQLLRQLEELGEHFTRNLDLTLVHELDEELEVVKTGLLEEDDRVRRVAALSHEAVEIVAARAEDEFVDADELALAAEGDVDEYLLASEEFERTEGFNVVRVPLETVFLHIDTTATTVHRTRKESSGSLTERKRELPAAWIRETGL